MVKPVDLLNGDRLLIPSEVAELLRVDVCTLRRWAADDLIESIKLPGGHRRYRESKVRELLENGAPDGDED